jgi:hypothetical protein
MFNKLQIIHIELVWKIKSARQENRRGFTLFVKG